MTCSKLTWSDLKADTLNTWKAGPKGVCSPSQLAIITGGDPCTITCNIKHKLQCLGKTVYLLAERDAGERSMNKTAKAQTW